MDAQGRVAAGHRCCLGGSLVGGQPASLRFPLDQGPQMGVRLRVRREDSGLGPS